MATVPSKKMIAICHYGGEFETNEDGSMWYGGGKAYSVDLDYYMQSTDFKQKIAATVGSTVEGILVKYFLPGNKMNLITVSKDEDFNAMVECYKESDQLEVFIMKESFCDYATNEIANDLKRGYAREQLLGSYEDAYGDLQFYFEKIMETNPGSVAILCTNDDMSFHRMFVSFYASISGFAQGCPPLLFLDGTPLNSRRYQGMLLTATSADGNDQAFPVAFAVVDEENDDNWRWFLSELKTVVLRHEPITFVAGFQKGLRESFDEIYGGECYHAYCLGYLSEKLNKDLIGHLSHDARQLMVEDLYAAAHAPKLEGFEKYTQDIKAISHEAYHWIICSEPDHWANAFFGGLRYNHMTCKFGNLFYSWLSEANELSITQMVDELRYKMMQMIYARRVESRQWLTQLTPSMEEKLKGEMLKSRSVQILRSSGTKFEIAESGDIVDGEIWDCSCKVWSLTGLPCCHAIAILETYGRSLYDFCAGYFHVEMYQLVYADSINPGQNLERLMDVELDDGTVFDTPTIRTPSTTKIRKAEAGQIASVDIVKHQPQGEVMNSVKQLLEDDKGDAVLGIDDYFDFEYDKGDAVLGIDDYFDFDRWKSL